ncbi:hypothetical protein S83_042316 [Arachis hypogaea]
MGCTCSKSSTIEDCREWITNKLSCCTRTLDLNISHLNSSKRVGGVRVTDKSLDDYDVKVSSIDKEDNNSIQPYDDQTGKKIEKPELIIIEHPAIGRIPKAGEAEQVSAGWPDWLSSVAGEAIKGWIPRSANTFERLHKIGQGTYSTVYKARDVTNQKIVALKKVYFDSFNHESIKFMARKILILRRLNHRNIIKLDSLITSQTSHSLYLVFEYMEYDLKGLASNPAIKFSESQLKCYMQ